MDEISAHCIDVLRNEGFDVRVERTSPTFARIEVASGPETCRVDFAQDARIRPTELSELGPILSKEELAADKMFTLFSRAEPRDFLDVYRLAERFGKERLLELAAEKDVGFDRGVFAQMLRTIARLDREEFDCDDETFTELKRFFEGWEVVLRTT